MARMRSIKPEFWTDQELASVVSRDARLLYVGLWNLADEHARLRGDPRYIKGQIFAYDDDLTPDHVAKLIEELVMTGKAETYWVAGSTYLFLPNLDKHQRLEPHKVPSRLPSPVDSDESAPRADSSEKNSDESAPRARASLKHVAGGMEHVAGGMETAPPPAGPRAREGARATRVPDPFEITDEMRSWVRTQAPNASKRDHDIFMDYWRGVAGSKGLKKDWVATWKNWMRRASDEKTPRSNGRGLVEVDGHVVTERTAQNMELARRMAAVDEQERLEIER